MMVIASLYSHSINEKCFRQSGKKESDGEERKATPYGLAAALMGQHVSGFSAFDIRRIIWTKRNTSWFIELASRACFRTFSVVAGVFSSRVLIL
jgi:hypothetical protein